MSLIVALFDAGPSAGVIGGAAAVALFLVLLGVAFIAFLALKRTLKMAFRLVIVGVIMLVALVGSVSLWYFASGSPKGPAPRPAANGRR